MSEPEKAVHQEISQDGSCPFSAVFIDFSSVLCILWILAFNHISLLVSNMSFKKLLYTWWFFAWDFKVLHTHTQMEETKELSQNSLYPERKKSYSKITR